MNRWSNETLTRLVFVLVGLVIGLLDYLIKRPNVQPDPLESIYKAFAATALLFIAETVLEIRDIQRREKGALRAFAGRNHNLTSSVLTQVLDDLDRAVTLREDEQVVIEHESLAIVSYDVFWKLLVDASAQRQLNVQTIHSCAMDVWVDHPLTGSLLARQKQFCKNGGTITRILCDRGSKPSAEVLKAAKQMIDAGVAVKYYDLDSRVIADHNFAWDFARVVETSDAAIWDSFAHAAGGVIGEAVYTSSGRFKRKDLKNLWARVADAADPISL